QVHDIMFPDRSDPVQDRLLASAVKRSKDITLAFLPRAGFGEGQKQNLRPLPEFADHARLGSIAVRYNYANETWQLPLAHRDGSTLIPSFASVLAQRTPES